MYPVSALSLVDRHQTLIDAIQTRDPVVATAAIRSHIALKLADIPR